jgi:REP-associated tyrosine transposase
MARRPREEFPGAVHHAFARGNRTQSIFLCNQDRRLYLHLLGEVVARTRWRVLAYCLMANHVHLLIETPEPNLGAGMQRLHGLYAQTFNRRHRHRGHLFQGRFGSVTVRTDEQLLQTARYIARNPVRAGLCAGPGLYPWSSHPAVAHGGSAPRWLDTARLLGCFGADGGDPRRRYADFVELR